MHPLSISPFHNEWTSLSPPWQLKIYPICCTSNSFSKIFHMYKKTLCYARRMSRGCFMMAVFQGAVFSSWRQGFFCVGILSLRIGYHTYTVKLCQNTTKPNKCDELLWNHNTYLWRIYKTMIRDSFSKIWKLTVHVSPTEFPLKEYMEFKKAI